MALNTLNGRTRPAIITGLAATGNSQATAFRLANNAKHEVAAVAAGSGVVLPPPDIPSDVAIFNCGANALAIYPHVGGTINGGSINVPISLAVGSGISLWASSGNWNVLSAATAGGVAVTSVAGRTGAVVLSTSDISGLGTAAAHAAADFDAAGSAAAAAAVGAAALAAGQQPGGPRQCGDGGVLTWGLAAPRPRTRRPSTRPGRRRPPRRRASSGQATSRTSPAHSTARTNLGLGSAAVQPSSAFDAAGAAAAAQASSLQRASNLTDLASASTARTNLGLGSAAVQPSSAFDAAGAAAAAQASSLQRASNLTDLASASTARTNLGLGSAAVQPSSAFDAAGAAAAAQASSLQRASNLSDLASASTARTNLGLAASATTDTTNASNITSGAHGGAAAGHRRYALPPARRHPRQRDGRWAAPGHHGKRPHVPLSALLALWGLVAGAQVCKLLRRYLL